MADTKKDEKDNVARGAHPAAPSSEDTSPAVGPDVAAPFTNVMLGAQVAQHDSENNVLRSIASPSEAALHAEEVANQQLVDARDVAKKTFRHPQGDPRLKKHDKDEKKSK